MNYRVTLARGARTDLDGFSRTERAFILDWLERLAASPSKLSRPAAEEVYPDGGMASETSMPVGNDATYFIVEFRYMPDEETLRVSSIGISRPPDD